MIQSFRNSAAEIILKGGTPRGVAADLARAARRRLAQLNAAAEVSDMAAPPGNRLHKVGDAWAVRVNDQYRIHSSGVHLDRRRCGLETTTDGGKRIKEDMDMQDYTTFEAPLPHPGELLREDFLPEYGLTAGALAKAMGLKDRTRIERLVREQQPVTSDTALRLARVFGTSPDLWMNLQTAHDLSKTARASREALAAITPLRDAVQRSLRG